MDFTAPAAPVLRKTRNRKRDTRKRDERREYFRRYIREWRAKRAAMGIKRRA